MISLLYTKEKSAAINTIMNKTLLTDYFSFLSEVSNCKENSINHFIEILSKPLRNLSEIRYRNTILADTISNPEILPQLTQLMDEIHLIHEESNKINKRFGVFTITNGGSLSNENRLHHSFAILQEVCIEFCKVLASFYLFLQHFNCHVKSDGIKLLLTYIEGFSYDNEQIKNLWSLCNELSNCSETEFRNRILVTVTWLDEFQFEITDICLTQKSKFNIQHKKSAFSASFDELLCEACKQITQVLKNVLNEIYSQFHTLRFELDFYRVATDIAVFLKKKGIPYCFPVFNKANNLSFIELNDLRLCVDLKMHNPDSFTQQIKCDSCLITGKNNTGKTVFLRSLFIMQLFAQTGLFVPAKSLTTTIFTAIAFLFSSEESGEPVGRFESEVQDLAEIQTVFQGELNPIVFLNEIFQSTNYNEGAATLADILLYWKNLHLNWILVSHLNVEKHINDKISQHIIFQHQYFVV